MHSPRSLTAISLLLWLCASAVAPPVHAQEAAPMFAIWEYRVLGNTVLPATDIETLAYPALGAGKQFADIETFRVALEGLYRSRGYATVFVDIPEQDVGDEGIVRLRVTEGQIGAVRITGARYFANGRLRAEAPSIVRGVVPNLPTLQAELGTVNQKSRDRRVTPVLRAGRTPGTVDVELKVDDELPLHAAVEVNDRYTADTSRTRASLNVSYDNLWQRYHSLSFQYQTAPEAPDEVGVLAATYVWPSWVPGHILAAYAVDTDSDVATVGALSVLGAGRIYGFRYIAPLAAVGRYSHNVTLGVDYKDFEEQIRLTGGDSDRTPIAYGTWVAAYAGTYRTNSTTTQFNLSSNLGMRRVGNDPDEFEFKRFKAKPNFFYLAADAQHERPLFAGATVFLRTAAQYVTEPLISNEQFAVGGVESVRGYLESTALGDYGVSGTVELRSPSLARAFGSNAWSLVFHAFYDAGVAHILNPIINTANPALSQEAQFSLSGWGAGFRLSAFGGLEASLDWATPLESTARIASGEDRLHFRFRYGF